MSDPNKTDPGLLKQAQNWGAKVNEKADPIADGWLAKVGGSKYTPVIIGAVLLAVVLLTVWVTWR